MFLGLLETFWASHMTFFILLKSGLFPEQCSQQARTNQTQLYGGLINLEWSRVGYTRVRLIWTGLDCLQVIQEDSCYFQKGSDYLGRLRLCRPIAQAIQAIALSNSGRPRPLQQLAQTLQAFWPGQASLLASLFVVQTGFAYSCSLSSLPIKNTTTQPPLLPIFT